MFVGRKKRGFKPLLSPSCKRRQKQLSHGFSMLWHSMCSFSVCVPGKKERGCKKGTPFCGVLGALIQWLLLLASPSSICCSLCNLWSRPCALHVGGSELMSGRCGCNTMCWLAASISAYHGGTVRTPCFD